MRGLQLCRELLRPFSLKGGRALILGHHPVMGSIPVQQGKGASTATEHWKGPVKLEALWSKTQIWISLYLFVHGLINPFVPWV